MKVASFESIARALNAADVRYLVVGGIAVNAYGYGRATYDVDLVVELTPESVRKTFSALAAIEYKPIVPITAEAFGDSAMRDHMISEKNMLVLQFFSEAHRETRLDIFAREPFPFSEEYTKAPVRDLAEGCSIRLLSLDRLVELKTNSARAKDLEDLENLGLIYGKDFKNGPAPGY